MILILPRPAPSNNIASFKIRVGNVIVLSLFINEKETTCLQQAGRTVKSEQLFEAALGMSSQWYVVETRFDQTGRTLTILVDFRSGSHFSPPDAAGAHPVHDTQTKRYLLAAGRSASELFPA